MAPRETDPRARVVDEQTFALVTELEVRKAVRLQYYVSLLAIQADPANNGGSIDRESLCRQLAHVISAEIRGTDLIGVANTASHLYILLVSANLYNLPVVIERITQEVSRRVFRVNNSEKPVRLAVGGACFPSTASDERDLFTQAASLVVEAREERAEGYRYRLASLRL